MEEKFFVHEIKLGSGSSTQKGIVICDNMDAALQAYHAYLGAYSYGHDQNITFCQAMITDMNGPTQFLETWRATVEETVEE